VTVFPVAPDVHLVSRTARVGNTVRQVNAVVIAAEHPMIVDTTFPAEIDDLIAEVGSIVDPANLAFIAVTHADPDHTGALVRLLLRAPHARVLTNAVGMEKLKSDFGLPENRFLLVEPGASIDLGDRRVEVHSVPLFDQPETMAFFDDARRVLCSSDCFGAVLPEYFRFADDLDVELYRLGFDYWNQSNHPWVRLVDPAKFKPAVGDVRRLEPGVICSSHGPVIRQNIERALEWIEALPAADVLPLPFPA